MIPALLQIVVVVAAGIIGGFFEGKADAKRAIANEEVEHKRSALYRVLIAIGIWVTAALISKHPWWASACAAIAALSAFSPAFRYTMNKRRKLDWRYMSPSNWYDGWFVCKASGHCNDMEGHRLYYGKAIAYTQDVHKAGRWAYAFEFSCLTLSTLLFLWGATRS